MITIQNKMRAAFIYFLALLAHNHHSVKSAISNPNFWDVSQEQLDELVGKSAAYFRPVEHMGNGAKLCNALPGYENETAYKLTNATVLVMDEELICKDFPSTCDMSTGEKETWLIDRAGWFSAEHIASGVNGDIPYDKDQSIVARRACAAGRALLLPTAAEGGQPRSIDVKGLGTTDPVPQNTAVEKGVGSHRDGLFSMFEAFYEYMNEKTIAAVLEDHFRRHPLVLHGEDMSFNTVGIYAVISLGFQIPVVTGDGTKYFVASGLLRQASRRHPNPHGWMDYHEAAVLEQILNSYGIRSDGPQNNLRFLRLPNPHCRRINLQGTFARRTLTDFGTIQGDAHAVEWPPKGDCLVHWGETGRIIETTLWNKEFGIGSQKVRDFLRNGYALIPPPEAEDRQPLDYEHIRTTSNVRMRQMWELESCWWNAECSVEAVRDAVRAGLLHESLFYDKNASDTCDDGLLSKEIGSILERGAAIVENVDITDPPERPSTPNVFKMIDSDGDNKLSVEETEAYFKGIDKVMPEGLMESEDKDGDGFVSWVEFSGPKGDSPGDEL